MNRNSLLEMSGRVMHMAARFTLNKGNSNPMMQELAMDFMNSEGRKAVEHIQGFGMTATPLPRDEDEQQQGGQRGPHLYAASMQPCVISPRLTSSGITSRGPKYAHTRPPNSRVG